MELKEPKLRFQEFNGFWECKKFSDIFSFRSTNSLSRDKLNYENGYVKNIHYGDIHTKFKTLFDIKNEDVPYINDDISLDKISEDNYLKIGDLIIADASEDYNDIGKSIEIINLNSEKVLAGLHTFIARPDIHKMTIGFSGYLMNTNKTKLQIKTIAQGTKVLSISTTRLSNIILDFPCQKEQTKITEFISSIDIKINLLKEKRIFLLDYKNGLIKQIFEQEIRFKDNDGNDFKEWETIKINELFKITAGGDISKENVSFIKNEIYKYPVYANSDKEKGLYGYSNIFKIEDEGVTVTGRGNVGIAVARNQRFYPIVRLLILKPLRKVNIYFYENLINSLNIINEGTGVPQLTAPQLSNYEVKYPVFEEQTKIAGFLSSIDDKIDLVNGQIIETQEYKKGLLQQMFI